MAVANQRFCTQSQVLVDWVAAEEIVDGKFWLCVIKSGLPAPQYDVMLSITEVRERLGDLLMSDAYHVFSNSGDLIAAFDGIKAIELKSVADLFQEYGSHAPRHSPIKLRGVPVWAMAAAGFLGVALLSSYAAITFMEGKTLREKAMLYQKQRQREENEKRAALEAALKTYQEEVDSGRE